MLKLKVMSPCFLFTFSVVISIFNANKELSVECMKILNCLTALWNFNIDQELNCQYVLSASFFNIPAELYLGNPPTSVYGFIAQGKSINQIIICIGMCLYVMR